MSYLTDVAYAWLVENSLREAVSSHVLWCAMQQLEPQRTAVSDSRKTPRITFMRDLRKDPRQRFVVENGKISLR